MATNQVQEKQKTGAIRWINRSGSLTLADGRSFQPGDEFTAHPDEIPLAFRDVIQPANQVEFAKATALPPITPMPPSYKVVPAGSPGRFNVVDGRGKTLSDKPLDAVTAKAMVERLMAD